ncbi:MAG: glycogen/starch/alpha-glucan phosphorylase [Myxococcales bacterium]|nr:glycogen/starch/alpha-glucan phosphorylase [Myxococcales bacterium]MDH3842549.1 glycogen/starch/alpha-glucan phosphorylase [Myxococcales bacterium]
MDAKRRSRQKTAMVQEDRTGLDVETLRRAIQENLFYRCGNVPRLATRSDYYLAVAYTVRDRLMQRWLSTAMALLAQPTRVVCYLSAEYLLGPSLGNALLNLGVRNQVAEAVASLGQDLDELIEEEREPGLGNGGLGRLAACFMDSLSTLQIPAVGYGLRYEFGIFQQRIEDGWQVEHTDKWLHHGNPWEVVRPEYNYPVGFGGHTESYQDEKGHYRVRWRPGTVVKGVAYATPVPGYKVNNMNMLRLWAAEAAETFDFESFNVGDYYGAVEDKVASETLTKVLYPNDEPAQGKQLRLQQQYFLVSCSLQDLLRLHQLRGGRPENLHEGFAIQLNDTHPALAIPELMRLLLDQYAMSWEDAWQITSDTFAYTNHTLLPEALETWPLPMFGRLLPRHLEIVYEINRRFMDEVRERFPDDNERQQRMSLIDDHGGGAVRMANLATVGSFSVNGVSALHTDLLKTRVMRDFDEFYPGKFNNKTNGVTPRRFVALANPELAELITEHIGEAWITDLDQLRRLEGLADDRDFQAQWRAVKTARQRVAAEQALKLMKVEADLDSMFDVQVKRIHEYKRQHLAVLHIVHLYRKLKENPNLVTAPRTFIFGGKAAPGYTMAKLIIKLINSVGEVVNADPDTRGTLKVVFIPNYNVKTAQLVYPCADLSEQISTAGKEASGTGNMKFSMNGALTIGTLDGANVEIRDAVGAENFFLFGLTADEIHELQRTGYRPYAFYEENAALKGALDLIGSGHFSRGDRTLFQPLIDSLIHHDDYFVLADFQSYIDCQEKVSQAWADQNHWTKMSILNAARMGRFSSDRTIRDYSRDIWRVEPHPVQLVDVG